MYYGYLNKNELAHHGIKGMKWGVRRYQNPDGTLTEKGRKRYYKLDDNGITYSLSEKGIKYNKKESEAFERYKNATAYNVQKVNPRFKKEFEEYKKARRENNKHYLEEREKWLKGEKYKKADYDTFKYLAYDDWMANGSGKKEERHRKALEKIVREAAKEHPLYEKSFNRLPASYIETLNSAPKIEQVNFGREVVNHIMSQLDMDTINLYEKEKES